jgi:hypothetical protein
MVHLRRLQQNMSLSKEMGFSTLRMEILPLVTLNFSPSSASRLDESQIEDHNLGVGVHDLHRSLFFLFCIEHFSLLYIKFPLGDYLLHPRGLYDDI